MKFFSSRKGFYVTSPILGVFFLAITIGVGASIMTENEQQVETARAGMESPTCFYFLHYTG